MPYTIWGAFDAFRKNTIDLDPAQSDRAKVSRDYLVSQIELLSNEEAQLPPLYGGYLAYGSFARKTKIRPLDDVDLLLPLTGTGTRAQPSRSDEYEYWLNITNQAAPLRAYPDGYGFVNSTKVINAIKGPLGRLTRYRKAEVKKDVNAVRLDLLSYEWSFDIVPAVPIGDGEGGISYYLIPDGTGNWLRTDPRIDAKNVTSSNQRHQHKLLPTIRLLKYWNQRATKPRLSSYYFEMLVLQVFQDASPIADFPRAIKYFFENCPVYLRRACPDPKNLGSDLDAKVSGEVKEKVVAAMTTATSYASYALMYEHQDKLEDAFYWWGNIFGPEFPTYGS